MYETRILRFTIDHLRVSFLRGFHTAAAILSAWALWPVRYIRPLAVVVNGLMILSTPISGQHYFVDVVAGGLVAWGGIAAAKWLNARWKLQERK